MRIRPDLKAAIAAAGTTQCAQLTLSELVAGYCAALPTTLDDLRLRKWVQAMGDLSAWDITSDMLDAASHALIESGLGVSTVNRDLSALGSAYRWAKAKRLSPRGFRSPTLGAQRFAEPIRRVEVSRDELERLKARVVAVRDRRFGVFVHLLLDTGARKSELLLRRWKDVDLVAGTILCPTTKTGIPRVLHFRPETADLMRRAFKTMPADQLVFEGRLPGTPINFRTIWRTVTAELGMPDLHLHDLRHLAAAELLRAGVGVGVAAQVLGHSVQVLSRRYGHLDNATMRAAQEARWSSQ